VLSVLLADQAWDLNPPTDSATPCQI